MLKPVWRGTLIAVTVAIPLACDETPADPEPGLDAPVDSVTRFSVSAFFAPTSDVAEHELLWQINVVLRPGLTADGTARSTNDTLMVNGEPLLPITIGENGDRNYRTGFPVPIESLNERIITLEPPRVDGIQLPTLRFSGIAPASSDTVISQAGADLPLLVDVPGTLEVPSPPSSGWTLRLRDEKTIVAALSGNEIPESEILIPGSFVTDAIVEAIFGYELRGQSEGNGSPVLTYSIRGGFRWILQIQ